jgi:hypothetical protein
MNKPHYYQSANGKAPQYGDRRKLEARYRGECSK